MAAKYAPRPDEIRIGAHMFTVEWLTTDEWEQRFPGFPDKDGLTFGRNLAIYLRLIPNRPESLFQEILLHEVLHALWGAVGMTFDETWHSSGDPEDIEERVALYTSPALLAAQGMPDDLVDGLRDSFRLFGTSVEHVPRRLKLVNLAVLHVDSHDVAWIEDDVPFRDEVPHGHTVLLGKVAQLRLVFCWVYIEAVRCGLVRTPPIHAGCSIQESEIGYAAGRDPRRRPRAGQLLPVVGQELLGEIRWLALEVQDVVRRVLRVVVGP